MLENPFKPTRPESDTDPAANANIVGTFLGPEAQAAYEKLDQGQAGKMGDDQSDLKLTDTEKAVVKEAREKEVWDRNRYIKWATSLGRDEDWVDKTFTFHDDGTVKCWKLYLDDTTELHEFPSDLEIGDFLDLERLTSTQGLTLPKKIGSYLDLQSITSAQGLTLPTEIGTDLDLNQLTTAQGLTLPKKIGGDFYLNSLTSTDGLIIPKDFYVGYDVYTNPTLLPFFEKLKEEGKVGGEVIVIVNHK